MTTALIGNQGSVEMKARVALISKGGIKDNVAASVARSGHEVVEFEDWSAFVDAAVESTMDLILFDDEQALGLPSDLSVPSVQVGERVSTTHASSLGCLPAAAFEAAIEPLLRIANELRGTMARCRELEQLVDGVRTGSALVGRSAAMRRLHTALSRAADTDATVLIEGHRGSGKSLVARIVHCKSRRSGRRIEVVASEQQDADSLAKALQGAQGTTLVLEDVDRLPAPAQSVLVRHLKERSSRLATVPRLISTTAAHLPELVAKGAFREDLYYRLHALPIVVPSLRERTDDIVMIAEAILDAAVLSTGKGHHGFTPAAVTLLESLGWPGNVAQLESTVRRAHALAGGSPIDREHLLAAPPAQTTQVAGTAGTSVRRSDEADGAVDEDSIRPFDEEEQSILSRALRATKGNVRRAAQLLGIGRATLYRKIQQYKLRLQ